MQRTLLLSAWLSALVLVPSCVLNAQVAGRISGFVHDPSGANVVGASVTAVSSEQQLTRTVQSDSTGFFNLLAMPPGVYTVTVESAGFDRSSQSGVRLALGESLRLDLQLALAGVASHVNVESTAALVNTTNQALSGLVDDRRVQDLPLNGRNVMGLARILPGVTQVNAPQELSNTR